MTRRLFANTVYFRVQIAKTSSEGYYVLVDGEKYIIDSKGKLPKWPNKFI